MPEPPRWGLAPGSSWSSGCIQVEPSGGMGVSEKAGLLLLEVVMTVGLHVRVF